MSISTTSSAVAALVSAFTDAAPDAIDTEYKRLVGALWRDGTLSELAGPAIPHLVAELERPDEGRQARLIVLLGLLAEAEYPASDGAATAAVRQGLDRYLDMLAGSANGQPVTLALLYLLSHLIDDRDAILSVAQAKAFDADDITRLERALTRFDPAAPVLGRVWPAPSVWRLTDGERQFDQAWISELAPAQIIANWENDTRTVFGYSGAKAYWAARYGPPRSADNPVSPDQIAKQGPAIPADGSGSGLEIFRAHAGAFRCPVCGGALDFDARDVRCASCTLVYPRAYGILDLTNGLIAGNDDQVTADLLQKMFTMPTMGLYYEAVLRPAFLRMAGSNWGDAVSPADEDRYIAEHLSPVDGPVLDLAAGAGRWTSIVARTVGADRVIALDMAVPMLTVLRARLPEVPAVFASALGLPFGDATLGAVNCWNALQAFPDDAEQAILEMGRCLRPGGTLTMMTFRFDEDEIYRHFQQAHHFPSRPEGLLLFDVSQLRRWLASAGLTIRDVSGPESFVFITAERTSD